MLLSRHTRRRDFIALFGGTAVCPLTALAQPTAMPVIGFLSPSSQQLDDALRLAPFRDGLKEVGYVEGRNVAIEYRGAEQHLDRLPELAADLVRRQVAVIVAAAGPQPALAAKAASTTVPIIFTISGDPVELGLVASYNRPGGNVTGVNLFPGTVVAKQFETLHEVVSPTAVMGCLLNPSNPNADTQTREAQEATRTLGRKLEVLHARNETEIESAFATIVQKHVGALVVTSDELFNNRPEQLVALTARHMLPTIYALREFAVVGGLMSYGTSFSDTYRQVAMYTDRILKGEKPADLPVIRLSKVELVINVKTANTLGVSFPLSLLGRANEVID
jgi:putative ABC transport system substrate-binding protein